MVPPLRLPRFALALLAVVAAAACGDDAETATAATGGEGGGSEGGGGAGGAATATGTASATSTGTGVDATFSVMTWNVESFPKSPSAGDVVTQVIAEQLPVVAAFEEVDDVQRLEQALDAVTNHDVVHENEPPFALVLAVDQARATVLDAGAIFSGETYLFPRAPLVARVALTGSDVQLDFVVVHQKAQVDEESEQRRRDANARLVAWCAQRFAATGAPIMLVGDFNDEVTETGGSDVFTAFKEATDPSYWFLTAESESGGEHSYVPFRSFIDHQIATDDLRATFPHAQTAVLHLDEQIDNYVGRVSDHRPVVVELSP